MTKKLKKAKKPRKAELRAIRTEEIKHMHAVFKNQFVSFCLTALRLVISERRHVETSNLQGVRIDPH